MGGALNEYVAAESESTWIRFRPSWRDLRNRVAELERRQAPPANALHPALRPERRQTRDLFPDAGAGAGNGISPTDLGKLLGDRLRAWLSTSDSLEIPAEIEAGAGEESQLVPHGNDVLQRLFVAQTRVLAQLAPKPSDPLNAALGGASGRRRQSQRQRLGCLVKLVSSDPAQVVLEIRRLAASVRRGSTFKPPPGLCRAEASFRRFPDVVAPSQFRWTHVATSAGDRLWPWNLAPPGSCSL